MKTNVKQHYIPQFYLKNFSNNGNLYVYDIKEKHSFTNAIQNVAFKKYFHNVNLLFFNKLIVNETFEEEDFIDNLINLHNESIVATFFDSFNPTRERIIKKDKRETISVIDFQGLEDFILIQLYRNPKFQLYYERIKNNYKIFEQNDTLKIDKIARGIVILLVLNELYYGRKTHFRDEILKVFYPIIEEIKKLKELINYSYKYVYWNFTDVEFITSDFGMAFNQLCKEDVFTTIFIPINTKIGVLLVNKKSSIWTSKITNNSSIIKVNKLEKRQIELFNQTIINDANRFIFSKDGYFPSNIHKVQFNECCNI